MSHSLRTTAASLTLLIAGIAALDASAWATDALARWYTYCYPVISHRMTEAVVAVTAFAFWNFIYSILRYLGIPRLMTLRMTSPSSKRTTFPIVDPASGESFGKRAPVSPTAKVGSLIPSSVYVLHTRSALDGSLSYYTVGNTHDFPVRTVSSTWYEFFFWGFANVFVYLGPIEVSQRLMGDSLQSLRYTDPVAPSFSRLFMEVAATVWAYDFVFYWLHRSFHEVDAPEWWRRLHITHHDGYRRTGEPLHGGIVFHHHLLDAMLQVGSNIFVQQIPFFFFLWPGPRHKLSKIVHNIVVTFLLIEAHSGLDQWWMSHGLFPSIFGGSLRHQIHHHSGKMYFHQFFCYLDDFFAASLAAKLKCSAKVQTKKPLPAR